MAYTEVKERNGRKYYYRVRSIRKGKKVSKERIYLGKNLSKSELEKKEKEADASLNKNKRSKEFEKLKEKIVKILKSYGIKKAGIFGSYVRGEQGKDSDIDILIQPKKNMSLLDISELKIEIEEAIGKKADLVEYSVIKPLVKNRILNEEVKII